LSDPRTCRIVWTPYAEGRAQKRKKSKGGVEQAIRAATVFIPQRKGREAIYGCVDGAWTQVIVKRRPGMCRVINVIPRGMPC
jgi:hypothetical protein